MMAKLSNQKPFFPQTAIVVIIFKISPRHMGKDAFFFLRERGAPHVMFLFPLSACSLTSSCLFTRLICVEPLICAR